MLLKQNMFVQIRIINKIKYLAINQEIFELDEVGEIVWDLIDGGTAEEVIIQKVAEKYKISPEKIHNDISSFVNDLIKNKLVEVESE